MCYQHFRTLRFLSHLLCMSSMRLRLEGNSALLRRSTSKYVHLCLFLPFCHVCGFESKCAGHVASDFAHASMRRPRSKCEGALSIQARPHLSARTSDSIVASTTSAPLRQSTFDRARVWVNVKLRVHRSVGTRACDGVSRLVNLFFAHRSTSHHALSLSVRHTQAGCNGYAET